MVPRLRMFIALLAGLLFLILQAVFPSLPFTEDQTVVFIGLIAAYILGEGLEGQRIGDNLKALLRSQKFQALVAGLLMIALKSFLPNFPLSEAQLTDLIAILGALIVGLGVQGAVTNAKG